MTHSYKHIFKRLFLLLFFISIKVSFASILDDHSGNILLYYDFEKSQSGLLEDKSGKKNDARISGTENFWSPQGIFGGGGYFSYGTRVNVNYNRRLSRGIELTIMMWVKPETLNGRMKVISSRNYETEFFYYLMGIDKGQPYTAIGDGDKIAATPQSTSLKNGFWHHLCMTISKDQKLTLYLDGKLYEWVSVEQAGFNTANASLTIGADFQGAEGYYQGFMDELIILNRALTAQEIENEVKRSNILQLQNITPEMILKNPDSFMVSCWPIDEGRGKTIRNVIKTVHTGVLSPGLESRWKEGFLSNSLLFNGKNDYIEIKSFPEISFSRSFSILCWINPQDFCERAKIVHKVNPSNIYQFYTIGSDMDKLYIGIGNGKDFTLSSKKTTIKSREWQQAGMLFDSQKSHLQLIYNGKEAEKIETSLLPYTENSPLTIGGDLSDPACFFNGEIARIQVFDICLPVETCKNYYNQTLKELQKITEERAKRAELRSELKKSFLELNKLNELLGETETVEDVQGKEEETLKKLNELIQKRLESLNKRKQEEFKKLSELAEEVKTKSLELNGILSRLGQPVFDSKVTPISEQMTIKDIINQTSELKKHKVEIELLIRRKKNEAELKEQLQKKKTERLKEEIQKNLSSLNQLNKELSFPETELDKKKWENESESYNNEIIQLISNREKEKEKKIAGLQKRIEKYREHITKLYQELKDKALLLELSPPKEVDLSSPLLPNIDRLKNIASFEEKVIQSFEQMRKDFSVKEKARVNELQTLLKNKSLSLREKNNQLNKLLGQLNAQLPTPIRLPDERPFQELKEALEYQKAMELKEQEILSHIKHYTQVLEEQQKKTMLQKKEELTVKFKKLRSTLLILNSELNIHEEWPLPKETANTEELYPSLYFSFNTPSDKKEYDKIQGKTFLELHEMFPDNYIPGKKGKSLSLNGVNNYINLSQEIPATNGEFSIGLWFKISRIWAERTIVLISNSDNHVLEVFLSENKLLLKVKNKEIDLRKKVETDKWYHLCVVARQRNFKIFVDGQEFTTQDCSFNEKEEISFGALFENRQFFSGALDEILFFAKAAEDKAVSGIMNYEPDSKVTGSLTETNLYLEQKIKEMTALVQKRETSLEELKKKREQKRQEALGKVSQTLNRLNEALKILNLPEYPRQNIPQGEEEVFLKKFETELESRLLQVRQKKELDAQRLKELQQKWSDLSQQLNRVQQKLGKPPSKEVFNSSKPEQSVKEMEELLLIQTNELQLQEEKKQNALKNELLQKRSGEEKKLSDLTNQLHQKRAELQKIEETLKQEIKQFPPLPWQNKQHNSLLAYYKFDTASPILLADSPKGPLIHFNDFLISFGSGKWKQAPGFKGNQTGTFTWNTPLNAEISVLFWLKPEKFSGKQILVKILRQENEALALTIDQSSLACEFIFPDEQYSIDTGTVLTQNEWQHIAFSIDKNAKRIALHINGQEAWQKRIGKLPEYISTFQIGGDNSRFFYGSIDELKIFNGILEDEEYAGGGVELTSAAIEYQIKYLEETLSQLNEEIKNKKSIMEKMAAEEKKKEEEEKRKFLDGLKQLNELHRRLNETEETEEDFNLLDPKYKLSILKSRVRRAKRRYQEMLTAQEEQRKETLAQINQERLKLEELYQKLGETGELFQNIRKGDENNALIKIKELVQNKELEYRKKLKDQEARFSHIESEISRINGEIETLSRKLKVTKASLPPLTKGKEDEILSLYQKEHSRLEKELKAREEERKKEFLDASRELEKLWEQLVPILAELKENYPKPEYDQDNVKTILQKVRDIYHQKKTRLDELKKEAMLKYETTKNNLNKNLEALKTLCTQLNEPVNFKPDFSHEGIFQSADTLNTLLSEKKKQYQNYLEKRRKEEEKAVFLLKQEYQEALILLNQVNEKLNLEEPMIPVPVIENLPSGLLAYYSFENPIKNFIFDWQSGFPLSFQNVTFRETNTFENLPSILFDGKDSYAESHIAPKFLSGSSVSISFFFKANRFWNRKSLLFLETGKQSGIDLFLDGNELKIRRKNRDEFQVYTKGIQIPLNKWLHVLFEIDSRNNTLILTVDQQQNISLTLDTAIQLNGNIRFGSYDKRHDFLSGEITNLKLYTKILSSNEKKELDSVLKPSYLPVAKDLLKARLEETRKIIKEREQQLDKLKKEQEVKRQEILAEIEKLKAELSELTGQTQIIFSVVIGEEEESLRKLKDLVAETKKEYEKKKLEEQQEKQRLQEEIHKKQALLEELLKEIGEPVPSFKTEPGKEKDSLKNLDEFLKQKQAFKLEKDIHINNLKNTLKRLYLQTGKPIKSIPFPDPQANITEKEKFLNTKISEMEKIIEKQKREKLLTRLENQYKIYSAILKEMERIAPPLASPAEGTENEALNLLNEKIIQAKKELAEYNQKREEKILNSQKLFESYLSQLKPLLKELNQTQNHPISFDPVNPDGSIEKIRTLLETKKSEVEAKQKQEEERILALKSTTEGLQKAIEEERNKIKSYANELKLENYKIPSGLSAKKKMKDIAGYFKFDSLDDKVLFDETGNSKRSFLYNFTGESKVVGKYGFAVQLNGLDQYISIETPENLLENQEISFSLWFNPNRTYGNRKLITSLNEKTNSGMSLYIEDSVYYCRVFEGSNESIIQTDGRTKKNEWEHILVSISKNAITLYANGVKIGEKNISFDIRKAISSAIIIGSDFKKLLHLFAGDIDEFKIYSTALTPDQIKLTMEEEFFRAEVADIDLLREEYNILQRESNRLLKLIKEALQAAEEVRLKKVAEINRLKEKVQETNQKMNLPPFNFSYETGKEDQAIEDLKKIKTDKEKELAIYEANYRKQMQKWESEIKGLNQEIRQLQTNLGMTASYEVTLNPGYEEEIIEKAKTYRNELKAEHEIQLKNEQEKKRLELLKTINDTVVELNKNREILNSPFYELPAEIEGKEAIVLEEIKKLNEEALVLIQKQKDETLRREQEEKRRTIIKEYHTLNREIRGLESDLGIVTDKKELDDPRARVYFNFDEGKGNLIKDKTIYGNRASFLDYDFQWEENALYNKGVRFTGNGGILKIEESASLNNIEDFTIMLWINPEKSEQSQNIFSVGRDPTTPQLSIRIEKEKIIIGTEKDIDTGISVHENLWQHLTVTFELTKKQIKVYLDGNMIGKLDYSDKNLKNSPLYQSPIFIGSNGKSEFYRGFMDEFKLFSDVLSVEEIAEHQKEGIPKIDTTVDGLPIEEITVRIGKLEEQLNDLRSQKVLKEQEALAKKNRILRENRILRDAEHRKNVRFYDNLCRKINQILKESGKSAESFPELLPDKEEEVIEKLVLRHRELVHQFSKASESRLKPFSLTDTFSPEDKLLCHLEFEKYDGQQLIDSSSSGQQVNFTKTVKEYLKEGLKGNSIQTGKHGYVTIEDNQTIPFHLRQSFVMGIYPDESSIKHSLLFKQGNLSVELYNQNLQVVIGKETIMCPLDHPVQANEWTLIHFSLDGFASLIQVGTGTGFSMSKSFTTGWQPQKTITLGGAPNESLHFNGKIDEVKIFNREIYLEDLNTPFVYNINISGEFTSSLGHVLLNIEAENADFVRVYQLGKIAESTWESYRPSIIIPVIDAGKRTETVTIIAELKNRFSDKGKEMRLEVPIPEYKNIEFVFPPCSTELTTR